VRRQRSDTNSSGRRWKILPSITGKSKSEAGVPNKSRKQDPPAASASSRTKYPCDPPSLRVSKAASASTESKSNQHELLDDFDRFMENPNLMTETSTTTRVVSFDPQIHMDRNDFVTSKILDQSSPIRPSYATFTPKSEYSSSRAPFSPDIKPLVGKKTSPTSVMDVPNGATATGVRWSENLTEQQFVSPDSARLDPFATDQFQYHSRSKPPKSILRKGSAMRLISGRKNSNDFFPYDEEKECPSDESPSKSSTRAVCASRNIIDPPTVGEMARSSSPPEFLDGNGRIVSPILADSPTAEHDIVRAMAEWSESHRHNRYETPSHYHDSIPSNTLGQPNLEDDLDQLSTSYVDFIEAVASVVIQTKVRQLLARRKIETMRNQKQSEIQERELDSSHGQLSSTQRCSVAVTQKASVASKGNQSLKHDAALDFYTLAAISIQAIFRGWWVRDCLAVDNYCATMIQKTYRRMLAIDALVTKLYCIVRIQSIMRGFLVRKRLDLSSSEKEIYNIAATILQAQWRSFSCEMKFLRAYEDILVVQSVARGWIARRLIFSWLSTHRQNQKRLFKKMPADHSISNSHGESFKKRQSHQSTPPGVPAHARIELSPSYLPHIEYMRNTLTPGSEAELLENPTRSQSREDTATRRNENWKIELDSSDAPLKESQEHRYPPNPRTLTNNKIDIVHDRKEQHFASSVIQHVERSNPGKVSEDAPKASSEIEQRRMKKELEAKSRQAEEKRRQEVQAAELAELEFRRKRMAMKAEVRKREETAIVAGVQQRSVPQDRDPSRFECSFHTEEKKESDSIISNPLEEQQRAFETSRDTKNFLAPTSQTKTTTIGPWQLKKRSNDPSTARKQDVSKSVDGTHNNNLGGPKQVLSGSRPPFTRNGRVVTVRKQQLFMSNGNEVPVVEENGEVTSVDVAEMNSIVGKKPAESERMPSFESTMIADNVVGLNTSNSVEESNPSVFTKYKDVDVSALTEPTAVSPMTSSTTPTPSKRVSGTNSSYVEKMRSQRTEAEQKRLDEMHTIFTKAGLMSRTKRPV
jgi:hypothetical protein